MIEDFEKLDDKEGEGREDEPCNNGLIVEGRGLKRHYSSPKELGANLINES